jgi:hypothetical protein
VFTQPPHPPDPASCDYYLFPKSKNILQEIKVPVSRATFRRSTAEVLPTVILSLAEMCDGRREQLQKQCAVKQL